MLTRATRRLGLVGLVAAIVGPLAAHAGAVAPMAGFVTMALGLLLALVSLVTGIAALVLGPGRGATLRSMVPGALVVGAIALVLGVSGGGDHPRINDFTTDTASPPAFVRAPALPGNAGRDLAYPGEDFARQQRAADPDLQPLTLPLAPDEAFARVQHAAHATRGWVITREDGAARALEGYDTSWLFRFADDFVIEVRDAGGGRSLVQMRSKSRNGRGDLGANAARIRGFLAGLAR
jgi:uncharacterized protein (DUF1499 family)